MVCDELAQLHLIWMMVLARIGKPEDGAHTRRGVHGILELTMGCVWGACTVTFNSSESVGPDWEARGWCAHSQGSARHPWADHGVCVGSLLSYM